MTFQFFLTDREKFKFHYNLTRITDTSHEGQYIFLIICRSLLFKGEIFQTNL